MIARSVLIASIFVVAVCTASFSQEINGGLDLHFGNGTTLFGVSGRYEAPIDKKFDWMATAGLGFGSNFTLFTLQAGVKYTFENENVYLGAELGPIFGSGNNSSASSFAFTPTIGYKWSRFDLSSRFFIGSGYDFFNIRFAYVFSTR